MISKLEKNAIELVKELMAIPGGSGEEAGVAEYIIKKLKSSGFSKSDFKFDSANKKSPIGGEIGNMVLKVKGTIKGPRRLLMAHMDTVPICVGAVPVQKGNVIKPKSKETGLGADDRSGCAVILNTLIELKRQGLPHPPLTFFWAVQEEIGLRGVRHMTRSLIGNPKLCFNWDGGPPNLAVIGATGDDHIDISIKGIPSHAGVHPEMGVNALSVASVAIADLVENGWHGLVIKGKNSGTSNIGAVEGGKATNVVMPEVTLKAEARSHSPKFRKRIVSEIEKAFVKAAKKVKNAQGQTATVKFSSHLKYESFSLKEKDPVVQAAFDGIKSVGLSPETLVCNGGLDANWMSHYGFPTVTLGCGQYHIHTTNEILDVPDYLNACKIALHLATGE